MNAPTLIQQLIIAIVGIASIPLVVAILAKVHLLPLSICLLAVNGFPSWAQQRHAFCAVALIVCIAYPALMWGVWGYRRWEEEQYMKGYLLSTAHHANNLTVPVQEETEGWDWDDDFDR